MEEGIRTRQSDVGNLLVVPTATDIAVRSWKPDLLEIGGTPRQALPQGRAEGVARLVKSEGLEGVLDLI